MKLYIATELCVLSIAFECEESCVARYRHAHSLWSTCTRLYGMWAGSEDLLIVVWLFSDSCKWPDGIVWTDSSTEWTAVYFLPHGPVRATSAWVFLATQEITAGPVSCLFTFYVYMCAWVDVVPYLVPRLSSVPVIQSWPAGMCDYHHGCCVCVLPRL